MPPRDTPEPSDPSRDVPTPEPGTDESAPPQTQEFGHDGAEHYPTEDDPS